jgi:2-dehydro-3-deoxyglucarate aldolase/4-hydroxy-2-oxoheptanedioate aldolase
MVTLDSPEVAEALSSCGFDWLFIDMEHGALDVGATQRLVQAMRGDCFSLARIPENTGLWIRRVLDTGCDGVVVPFVCSADDARQAVDAARYPPDGHRSVGVGRAHGYGLRFGEYVAEANDRVTVIVQVEHISAVERIDEILEVPGIDGILIGPYDLSGSMNRLGDVNHPEVRAAITTVRIACSERGMPLGIFVFRPEEAAAQLEQGVSFLIIGTDVSLMTTTAKQALQTARSHD